MKTRLSKLFICIVLVLFFVSPVFAGTAKVTYVKGKVEVLKNQSWVQLNVGDLLQNSDTVSTGFQSELKIEYGGSVMSLGALTRITLENMSSSEKKDNVSVYLDTGAVRSKVTHTQDRRVSYTVKSPVAVASVRGTDFTFTAKGNVTCHGGAVVVYPNTAYRKNRNDIIAVNATREMVEAGLVTDAGSGDSELPGDYGAATPTTPADEIDGNAPAGAIVVGKNQTVTIQNDGNTETPLKHASKKNKKVQSTITTAADQEAVVVGSSAVVEQKPAKEIENESARASTATGSLVPTIRLN